MMEHWLCCGRLQEFKLLPPSPAISQLKIEFILNYELRGGADSGGVSTDPLTSQQQYIYTGKERYPTVGW